ncbi:MAG: adenosylcobinamide-GDP ribazoletransferase [Halobacteriales archaeon]
MVVTALRGALGFLSRLPVGHDEGAWAAFRAAPAVFPLSGYLLGALIAPAVLLPAPPPATAFAFLAWVYLVTGINHLDGVADLGDALVVHGDADDRRAVMRDTTTGVGALLAVGLVLAGLALSGLALAGLPARALGLVVAAEVAAKAAMAVVVCLGSAAHEGLGSELTGRTDSRSLVLPLALAAPAAALTWPRPAAGVALGAGLLAGVGALAWGRARLGGVSGDVIGAANEAARVLALHAGVIAWTRF